MNSFLDFLSRIGCTLFFILLQIVSLTLLFTENDFHQSVFFSTSSKVNASLLKVSGGFSEYLNLYDENNSLMKENNLLLLKVQNLEAKVDAFKNSNDSFVVARDGKQFDSSVKKADIISYIPAKIINNSFKKIRNYITINVGRSDGLRPEMGVTNSEGVVGVVSTVSEHFAIVIPILNPILKISAKLKNNNMAGSIYWDGLSFDSAGFEGIPIYADVKVGDSIVSSGYSSMFPEGLNVGVVKSVSKDSYDNFYNIKVNLSVRFNALSEVRVINFVNRSSINKFIKKEFNED